MAKGKRQAVDRSGETKAEKFRRLANGRAKVALKAITGLGKLSTSSYEYDEKQVEALRKHLLDRVNASCDALASRGSKGAEVGDIV